MIELTEVLERKLCFGYLQIELKLVADKYFNRDDWKESFQAFITDELEKDKLVAAVKFYHGGVPVVRVESPDGKISSVFSHGYYYYMGNENDS